MTQVANRPISTKKSSEANKNALVTDKVIEGKKERGEVTAEIFSKDIKNGAGMQVDFNGIPEPLKQHDQWVAWILAPSLEIGKKPDKIPINVKNCKGASSTDRKTWVPFDKARVFFEEKSGKNLTVKQKVDGKWVDRTGPVAGVGFVFSGIDPLIGIDLDDCIGDDGKLLPWADDIVKSIDSYTEISQSGRGIHTICYGSKPGLACKNRNVECYQVNRFFAITGRTLNGYGDIHNRVDEIATFYKKHLARPEEVLPKPLPDRTTYAESNVDTTTVMARIRRSRSASKVESLLHGNDDGYRSASEADQAVCNYLAFYCGEISDAEAFHIVDRIFRESSRYRKKWDQVHRSADGATYGQMTINNALAGDRYKTRENPPEPPPDLPPLDTYDTEPIDTPPEPSPETKPARRFGFIHNSDLEAKIPEWVVRPFIESDSLVQIFGDPNCGKSFIGLDIAACVATGKDFHGKQTSKSGAAYYIAAEGRNGIKRRLKAWENRYQQPLVGWPLFISTGAGNLCDPESAAEIVDAIEGAGEPPAVIVIDTLARNFGPGDENSTKDMNMFIAALDRIRERYRCTIILIHHTGHGDKSRGRGAMALKGALDAEYRLDKDIYGVVRCEATKMKDAEIPEPMAFTIVSVEIGMLDEDGEPVTSAVLDSTDYKAPEKASTGKGKHQAAAVKIVQDLYDQQRHNLEEKGFCPSTARVRVDDWRTACIDSGMNRTNFHRVKHSLADQGVVFIDHGFVTLS